jgi:hypothetical protein
VKVTNKDHVIPKLYGCKALLVTCSEVLYKLLNGTTQTRGDFRTAGRWMGWKLNPKKSYPPSWMLSTFMENWEV